MRYRLMAASSQCHTPAPPLARRAPREARPRAMRPRRAGDFTAGRACAVTSLKATSGLHVCANVARVCLEHAPEVRERVVTTSLLFGYEAEYVLRLRRVGR